MEKYNITDNDLRSLLVNYITAMIMILKGLMWLGAILLVSDNAQIIGFFRIVAFAFIITGLIVAIYTKIKHIKLQKKYKNNKVSQ